MKDGLPSKLKGNAQVSEKTTSRRLPRQDRARITVAAIVEAAGKLLCEVGYAATTTNAIAQRAGVSIGSLYQYFGDKDDIFRAILEQHHQEMAPIAGEALEDLRQGRAVHAVLQQVLEKSLVARRRNPRLMTALHEELAGLGLSAAGDGRPKGPAVWELFATELAKRQEVPSADLREKSWLVTTILEAVGRCLVHQDMPDLNEETLLTQTSAICTHLIQEPGPPC